MTHAPSIEAVGPQMPERLDAFFAYLRAHVAENGAPGGGHFLPMPRAASRVSAEREQRFRSALAVELSEPGWRRLWLGRAADGEIAGHVDLRAHDEPFTSHRCLLGLGVNSAHRRLGVGAALLRHAADWAHATPGLAWIDLQVLSVNTPARRLYQRLGFVTVGEVPEMFLLDGQAFGYTHMALRLGDDAAPRAGHGGSSQQAAP